MKDVLALANPDTGLNVPASGLVPQESDPALRFLPASRFVYLTTKAHRRYTDWTFSNDDCLIFGRETGGLPESVLRENWDNCITIPMLNPKVRSLNLAMAVGIVLYEALRQTAAFSKH